MSKWVKEVKKQFPDWAVTMSKGNHLVLTHKDTGIVVHTSGSPSDHRVMQNLKSKARHALEGRVKFKGLQHAV
ncbi:hypothetical protein Amme3_00104 [Pseudomonas phage vB_PpuM-Amme-3]|uniref:Uncharacterized protein n=1 Tax=Pseudomonas phage vB_PpuM-Amme-3 TaxID=3132617 RepID=A0AAX4MWN5_9CAUD